jgi:FAD/FMN-containing dehydrogenase
MDFIAELRKDFPALECLSEASELEHWGRDWTRFHAPSPIGIVFPRSSEELSRLLKFCSKHSQPVVPSGGRTGLGGGAVATRAELVVNLSRLTKIEAVDVAAGTIRVQAGAVTRQVQEAAKEAGLYWPIDLASAGSSQIGGNIATNAGGLHVIRYGHVRRWVQSLEVVLMNGEITELNGDLDKNNTGYDLRNLFIGSEGTLGFVTAATLKLCEAPRELKTFLWALPALEVGTKVLGELRELGFMLHSFEVFSKNCYELVQRVRGFARPFEKPAPFYLLFEVDTLGAPATVEKLEAWMGSCFDRAVVEEAFMASSPADVRSFWAWRENITESLNQTTKVYKNDLAVPLREIAAFAHALESRAGHWFGEERLFLFGHLGDGSLHVNLSKPDGMEMSEFLKLCERHNHELFALVQNHRGSIAAEHGIGLLKRDFLHYSKSPVELRLMKELKKVFDPQGLMNPGKLLSNVETP